MKKAIIASVVASLLLIVCLAPTVSATLIDDNPEGTTIDHLLADDNMVNNRGTIGQVYGTLTNNYGTIGEMDSGTVTTNIGFIDSMYGGTVTTNSGTIDWISGGTVGTNSGEINRVNGGTVTTNSGTINNVSYGTVVENTSTGTINIVSGDEYTHGTVTTNNGTISDNHGEVGTNGGTITDNFGTVTNNTGTIENNWGTVANNTGTITTQYYPITMANANSAAVINAIVNYDCAYVTTSTEASLVPSAGYRFTSTPTATGCTLVMVNEYKYNITAVTGPITITAVTESESECLFWVGSTAVTGTASGAGWSYDSGSNTLTLNGAILKDFHYGAIKDFNKSNINSRAIIYDGRDSGLNIVVQGTNTVSDIVYGLNYAIYVKGNLNISGTGTLNAVTNCKSSVGIWSSGTLTISGGNINAYGCTVSLGSEGNMTFSGGTINAEVDRGGQSIFSPNGAMEISGATVTTCALHGFDVYLAWNSFTISSGTLNLAGTGCLDVNGAVTITGGLITSTGVAGYLIGVTGGSCDAVFTMSGGNFVFFDVKKDQQAVYAQSFVLGAGVNLTNLTAAKWDGEQGKYVPCDIGEAGVLNVSADGDGSIGVGISGYTVTFDANGGTGSMASAVGISGEYTLPANGFTPPTNKVFKCWLIGEAEKNPGDKINVTANVTVKASWKDAPAPEPEYTHEDVGGKEVYSNEVASGTDTNVTGIFTAAKAASGVVDVKVGTMNIAFDSDAVTAIGGNTVSLKAEVKTTDLDVEGAKAVIEVTLDGATFANGKATVTMPFTESVPDGKVVKVYFINGTEKTEVEGATLVDGNISFTTNHFSKYAVFIEDSSSSGGINIGLIIGIIVAVVAVAGVGVFIYMKKH